MGSIRALLALSPRGLALAATCLALLGACGSTSQAPPGNNDNTLDCLAFPLTSFCCDDAGARACPGDFAAAQLCSTWPAGYAVRAYPAACHGLLAVAFLNEGYTTVYAFDATSGALYAIGDDAASDQPGSVALECGAGPEGFTMPSDCAATWLDKTQGVACGAGTATATSICK